MSLLWKLKNYNVATRQVGRENQETGAVGEKNSQGNAEAAVLEAG